MKKVFVLAFILFLGTAPVCLAGGLVLDSREGEPGETVTFTLSVENAPNAVNAFVLDVHYDPATLLYTGYQRGGLASGQAYPMLLANQYQLGIVRFAGVDAIGNGIRAGGGGGFLKLRFTVTGAGESRVSFGVLKDDLEGWAATEGIFTGQEKKEDEDKGKSHEEESAGNKETAAAAALRAGGALASSESGTEEGSGETGSDAETETGTGTSGGFLSSVPLSSAPGPGTKPRKSMEEMQKDIPEEKLKALYQYLGKEAVQGPEKGPQPLPSTRAPAPAPKTGTSAASAPSPPPLTTTAANPGQSPASPWPRILLILVAALLALILVMLVLIYRRMGALEQALNQGKSRP